MSTLTDRFEFVLALRAEIPRLLPGSPNAQETSDVSIAAVAARLIRYGRGLHRLAEHACNYGSDATDLAIDRAQKRVKKLLAPYNVGVVFSGDPRGCVLKLILPNTKRTNDWGGEGFCVPS